MFKSFISVSVASLYITAVQMPAYLISNNNPAGFYAQICGRNISVFISLTNGGDEEPSQNTPSACHAICSYRDSDGDDEAEDS